MYLIGFQYYIVMKIFLLSLIEYENIFEKKIATKNFDLFIVSIWT